jgi:hypothetical protein
LGHEPPVGKTKARQLLAESERRFFEEFASHRFRPYS